MQKRLYLLHIVKRQSESESLQKLLNVVTGDGVTLFPTFGHILGLQSRDFRDQFIDGDPGIASP